MKYFGLNVERSWCFLGAFILLGLALRLVAIGAQSLWLDEMTSIEVSRRGLHEIILGRVFDNHTPPLYYILLNLWARVIPLNEVTLRLLSVLIDYANVLLLAVLSSRFLKKTNVLIVVAAYAISPFMLYYSQEGRMYTLLAFMGLLYSISMERIAKSTSQLWIWSVVSGLVFALGFYTHYYMIFFAVAVISLCVYSSWHSPRRLLAVVVSCCLAGMLILPWIPIVLNLAASGGQQFREFSTLVLPYAFFRFVVGYGVFPLSSYVKQNYINETISHWPDIALVYVSLLLLLMGAFNAFRGNNRGSIGASAWIAGVTILASWLVSFKIPMLSERYLIIVLPFVFFCLLSYVNLSVWRHKFAVGLLFLLMIGGDVAYFFNPGFGKAQWRELASYVSVTAMETDAIFIEPDYAAPVFRYYYRGPQSVYAVRKGVLGKHLRLESLESFMVNLDGRRVVLITSGYNDGNGCYRTLSKSGRLVDMRIFPLDTGIVCTIWQIGEPSLRDTFLGSGGQSGNLRSPNE